MILRACLESPCVNHIENSPQTVTVTYRVDRQQDVMSLSLARNRIDLDAFVLDTQTPNVQTVNFTLPGSQSTDPRPIVSATGTNKAITHTYVHNNGGSSSPFSGAINIELNPLTPLGIGDHADTVTVRACVDSQCAVELPGSPATITLNYAVRDVLSGPGYRARAVLARTNDMVWDATRQVMYVAFAANAPAHANTIGVLDPLSGTFSSFFPAGNEPGRLALSPDGQYLYVGMRTAKEIQRFVLPAMTSDLSIPLDGYTAGEMQVSPLSPQVLAVVRTDPSPYDLAIFDGSVMRTESFRPFGAGRVNTFQWDGQNRMFGVSTNGPGANGTAYQFGVVPEGVQLSTSAPDVSASSEGTALLLNGRMYMQKGRVFDPLTFAQLGSFTLKKIYPDKSKNKQTPAFDKAEIVGVFDPITATGPVGPGPTTLNRLILVR